MIFHYGKFKLVRQEFTAVGKVGCTTGYSSGYEPLESFRNNLDPLSPSIHNKSFAIVKASIADRKEVLRLMQDVFYKTDPSSIYSKVSENPQISTIVQEMTVESLDENHSFIAKKEEKDKGIIGVAINGIRPITLQPGYMDSLIKQVNSKSERTLLELWKFISMMPPNSKSIFQGEEKLFEIRFLAVDPAFRNQGIATSLVNASIKEAKIQGYNYVRVDCTSHFTARIASGAGMGCVYEMNYQDYKNPSGEQVFKDVNFPHTKVVVYVGKNLS